MTSIWQRLGVEDAVVEVLASVQPSASPRLGGRPFLIAYQLAVLIDDRHPEVRRELGGIPVGGATSRLGSTCRCSGCGESIVGLALWVLLRDRASVTDHGAVRYSVLSTRAIWLAAGVIVLLGVGVAVWLLWAFGAGDAKARNQLEAIKTAGTIVVGTGGAAALLLAARRQRTAEIALKQKDRDQADVARAHALQERVAAAAETDAAARRITELYGQAIDQLGSDKAPVRLGGLYALERVAQTNPDQRQTIVNVLCAYLRMPLTEGDREVRLTAQRLLTDHLQPGEMFWDDIRLDLTGATLIDFSLFHCTVQAVSFRSATFTGRANFHLTTFTGFADFGSATFNGIADFGEATFVGQAYFRSATFAEPASFDEATFGTGLITEPAYFRQTNFTAPVSFRSAAFTGRAVFASVTFARGADFTAATFSEGAPGEVSDHS